jgi:ABC-2 type transport system ATP-binding protein
METMIRVENLSRRYGRVRALNGLEMQVPAGAVYGFLGPNGAGKTTTLRILTGLARADKGQVWLNNQPLALQKLGNRPSIGVLPEEPAFYTWMTPREYLRDFVAPLYKLSRQEAVSRSGELLEVVGLSYAAERRIGGFSRGMRQRLGLAKALLPRSELLLLDEPVSALDPAGRKEVLDLIELMRGQATVLLSTHILSDVERVCDKVGIINKGKMIIESPRQELLDRYALPIFEVESENGFGDWIGTASQIEGVERLEVAGRTARVFVKDVQQAGRNLLASIMENGIVLRRFEKVTPSLEDIFLTLTSEPAAEKGS